MAYEAEGQRIAIQLKEQFGQLLEARLGSPITLVFEHGQWAVPSNFIFKFGYAGSGPDCFQAFLDASGLRVTKAQVEQAKAGDYFRAPGYAPVDHPAVAAQAAAAKRERARQDHERAVGLMDQGMLREALDAFSAVRAAIADTPQPMNLLNIAVCHARLGEFKEALAVLDEAMLRWPADLRLRANYEAIKEDAPKPTAAPVAVVPPPPMRVQSSAGVSSPTPPPMLVPSPAAGETGWPPAHGDVPTTAGKGTPAVATAARTPVASAKPAAKPTTKAPARSGSGSGLLLAGLAAVAAIVVGVTGWWIVSTRSAGTTSATEQPAVPGPDPSAPSAAPAAAGVPASAASSAAPPSAPPPADSAPAATAASPAPAAILPSDVPASAPAAAAPPGARAAAPGARSPVGTRSPAPPDVPASTGDASAGRAGSRREFDLGTASEGANDLTAALQHFQAARRLDGTSTEAQQAITRVTARMNAEGNDAFVRARQYDALDRTEQAITWYERAYRSLPDDNPNRRVARERLDALRRR